MLYINGEWRAAASGRTFESRNPATGEVIDSVADAGVEDVRAAVDAAAAAFEPWAARTAYERSAYLYQAYQLMLERREALAKLMTEEQGKPIRMARNEVGYAADFLLVVRGRSEARVRPDDPVGARRSAVPRAAPAGRRRRRDHPVELPGVDAHPEDRARLAAGCTIVIKPAEQTPLLRSRCSRSSRRSAFPRVW